jgi:beta-glucosidase
VALRPGEAKTVHFALGKNELTYWSESRKAWVEEPEEFDVLVGNDSNAQLRANFHVIE